MTKFYTDSKKRVRPISQKRRIGTLSKGTIHLSVPKKLGKQKNVYNNKEKRKQFLINSTPKGVLFDKEDLILTTKKYQMPQDIDGCTVLGYNNGGQIVIADLFSPSFKNCSTNLNEQCASELNNKEKMEAMQHTYLHELYHVNQRRQNVPIDEYREEYAANVYADENME